MLENRILFTGGGTAGHVIVNLALIPVYLEEGWKVDYIGSSDGIERGLIEGIEGVTYHPISTGKLRRYMSWENFKDPFKVLKGMVQSWNIIRKNRPQVLFSKGGFVSVPVVLAAKMRRIPTIIHESDFTPGLANKIAVRMADHILTTFPETINYLPKEKTKHIGAVVREELFEGSRERGYAFTGLNDSKPILLVMGGSAGSENINQSVRENLPNLLKDFQVAHICGQGKLDEEVNGDGYVQFEYVNEELADVFAITDFVISRAGSNAIFEFLALRIPMLLIPLSEAASRGDQIVNAESFKNSGYARVLEEENLTEESLMNEVRHLREYGDLLKNQMKNYENTKAMEEILQLIEEIKREK